MSTKVRYCNRCILDSNDDHQITFDINGILEKMKEKRYLYLVEKQHFVPHEKGNNIKFFSQEPALIIDVIKIKDVYEEYFNK